MTTHTATPDEYDRYLREEWTLLARDPARIATARSIAASLSSARILDVGCGAGQELRPFAASGAALGVGIDVSPDVGRVGRELFAREEPAARVAFARAQAERLPFRSTSFDVVICRLALPYTDNAAALAEMSRVLRPAGVLILKIHHARYYLRKLAAGLTGGDWKSAIHACRVLSAGVLYHLSGRQPRGRITGGETFQTLWLLKRELGRNGLAVEHLLADSAATPSLLARKDATTAGRRSAGASS